jgi:hypothetical protein
MTSKQNAITIIPSNDVIRPHTVVTSKGNVMNNSPVDDLVGSLI